MSGTCQVPVHVESPPLVSIEHPHGTTLDVARNPDAGIQCVEKRLAELDAELEVERTCAADAAKLGVTLALDSERQWLLLPGAVGVFDSNGSASGQGPQPTFRIVGCRSEKQIEEERAVLNAIRSELGAHQIVVKQEAISRFENEGGPAVETAKVTS